MCRSILTWIRCRVIFDWSYDTKIRYIITWRRSNKFVTYAIVWQRTEGFVQRRHQFPPLTLVQLSPVAWRYRRRATKYVTLMSCPPSDWLTTNDCSRHSPSSASTSRAKSCCSPNSDALWNCGGSCVLERRRHGRPEVDSELRTVLNDAKSSDTQTCDLTLDRFTRSGNSSSLYRDYRYYVTDVTIVKAAATIANVSLLRHRHCIWLLALRLCSDIRQ